ncbi:hypothetical protein Q7P37_001598 [Cladosporium fusiforme]
MEADDCITSDPQYFEEASEHIYPPGRKIPFADAQAQRDDYVARIFKDHQLLGMLLAHYGQVIPKRWVKKTHTQRLKIVLEAWDADSMAADHRPEFKAITKVVEGQSKKEEHRDSFMMPYINQKDLTSPVNLIHFLASRARHHPRDFATQDAEAMGLGIITPSVFEIFDVPGINMMFIGRTSTEQYAEIVPYAGRPCVGCIPQTCQFGMQPGLGLLVLEAQARTLSFLVACAKLIVHDLDLSEQTLLQDPLHPASNLLTGSEHATPASHLTPPASLMTTISEAPYRPPVPGSLVDLKKLLAAKRDEAADHLWSLREDPSYFAAQMFQQEDHGIKELSKRFSHAPELVDGLTKEEDRCIDILLSTIVEAYCRFEEYSVLHRQAEKLCNLQEMSENVAIVLEFDGLPQHVTALEIFKFCVRSTVERQCAVLRWEFPASPPIRGRFNKFFNIVDGHYAWDPAEAFKPKKPADMEWLSAYSTWRILCRGNPDLTTVGVTTLVDELQGYTDSKAQYEDLLSPLIASRISDMAINGECLRQVKCHPWALEFPEPIFLTAQMKNMAPPTRTIFFGIDDLLCGKPGPICQHFTPLSAKLFYPVGKSMTKSNVGAMRKAENGLDSFWRVFDQTAQPALKGTSVGSMLAEPRLLHRTPAWVEPANVVPQPKGPRPQFSLRSLSELQARTEKTLLNVPPRPMVKSKKKTRGVPLPKDQEPTGNTEAENIPQSESQISRPQFKVDKHALKVFDAIFFKQTTAARPGEIAWKDFLHAMEAIGFASQKLMGSAWHFSPVKPEVERSIQFHEPHPTGKIPYQNARRIGRRLNRAYGWVGDMFVLAEKSG